MHGSCSVVVDEIGQLECSADQITQNQIVLYFCICHFRGSLKSETKNRLDLADRETTAVLPLEAVDASMFARS
jgi:hypothetical protein